MIDRRRVVTQSIVTTRRQHYRAFFEFGLNKETLPRNRNTTNGEWPLRLRGLQNKYSNN
jgi:hypothetical protein